MGFLLQCPQSFLTVLFPQHKDVYPQTSEETLARGICLVYYKPSSLPYLKPKILVVCFSILKAPRGYHLTHAITQVFYSS